MESAIKTLKTVTNILCDVHLPTASVILPLKHTISQAIEPAGNDIPMIREMNKKH